MVIERRNPFDEDEEKYFRIPRDEVKKAGLVAVLILTFALGWCGKDCVDGDDDSSSEIKNIPTATQDIITSPPQRPIRNEPTVISPPLTPYSTPTPRPGTPPPGLIPTITPDTNKPISPLN